MKPDKQASIIILLIFIYVGDLSLNILLNPSNELKYTKFTLFLALPTGIPLLSLMSLFKKGRVKMIISILMILFVALIDLSYSLWLIVTFSSHKIDFNASGIFQFVALNVFFFIRVLLSIGICFFLYKVANTPFEERFALKHDNRKQ